jgi:hypothetical protein
VQLRVIARSVICLIKLTQLAAMRRRLPVGRELLSTIHALLGSQPPGELPAEAEPKTWSQRQAASAIMPGAAHGCAQRSLAANGVDGCAGACTQTHLVPAPSAKMPKQAAFKVRLVGPRGTQGKEAEELVGERKMVRLTTTNLVKASSSASTGSKAAAAARVSVML